MLAMDIKRSQIPPTAQSDRRITNAMIAQFNALTNKFNQVIDNLYRQISSNISSKQNKTPTTAAINATSEAVKISNYSSTLSEALGASKVTPIVEKFEKNKLNQIKMKQAMTEADHLYNRASHLAEQLHNQMLSSLRLQTDAAKATDDIGSNEVNNKSK